MSFGRKQSQPQFAVNQQLDKQVQQYNDLFKQYQSQFNIRQKQLDNETTRLLQTSTQERKDVNRLKSEFFKRLKQSIDDSANTQLADTRSDLAARFGGVYHATFGTDLLSRIEKGRLDAVKNAQVDANDYAQEMTREREQSRLRRLGAVQAQYEQLASGLRDTGVMRSSLLRLQQEQALEAQQRQARRRSVLGSALGFVGGSLLGGPVGGALGSRLGGSV